MSNIEELERLNKDMDKSVKELKKINDAFFTEFGISYEDAKRKMVEEWTREYNKKKNIKYL